MGVLSPSQNPDCTQFSSAFHSKCYSIGRVSVSCKRCTSNGKNKMRWARKNGRCPLSKEADIELDHPMPISGQDETYNLMLWYAQNGMFQQSQDLWDEIINSSYEPGLGIISSLMDAYCRMGQFDEAGRVFRQVASRYFGFSQEVYVSAISSFGKAGQLDLMQSTLNEMISKGFKVDSSTSNMIVRYYSMFGTLSEMETAYEHLKTGRILVDEKAIKAISLAYIREKKFYRLGEFVRDVGLDRRNCGNLLWNLLLLSYAVNFKMKSLQREFVKMVKSGFSPDLNTFNIRALAFSRMCLFWDLHLSISHMKHERIVPDLVTYGCIVDAYIERRLGRNLSFALDHMDLEVCPGVTTDPLVFEAFGKGEFHSCSEALLESKRRKEWTYAKLIKMYIKRRYRDNQIFWNY